MATVFRSDGTRLCGADGCGQAATHALTWTDGWVYYCESHALWMVHVGKVMGFITPGLTLREISPSEANLNVLAIGIQSAFKVFFETIFRDEIKVVDVLSQDDGTVLLEIQMRFSDVTLKLLVAHQLADSAEVEAAFLAAADTYVRQMFRSGGWRKGGK